MDGRQANDGQHSIKSHYQIHEGIIASANSKLLNC